MNSVKALRTDC